jgi:DNA polymerase-1
LIADLKSGADLHSIRAAELFGVPHYVFMAELNGAAGVVGANGRLRVKQRKLAKALSFQLQYGSGPTNMAKTNKIPLGIAQKFIKQYYDRYPRVKEWQNEVAKEVKKSRVLIPDARTDKGLPKGEGFYVSATGRRYRFEEYDSFDEGEVSFSPTQMKNFPVQGFATGDIVPMVLGKVFRGLMNSDLADNYLMVNTIHDSVLFDAKDYETMEKGTEFVVDIMQKAPQHLQEQFGIKMELPLTVEAKYGLNWGNMAKFVDRVPF